MFLKCPKTTDLACSKVQPDTAFSRPDRVSAGALGSHYTHLIAKLSSTLHAKPIQSMLVPFGAKRDMKEKDCVNPLPHCLGQPREPVVYE